MFSEINAIEHHLREPSEPAVVIYWMVWSGELLPFKKYLWALNVVLIKKYAHD